jgi:hypothetical protein
MPMRSGEEELLNMVKGRNPMAPPAGPPTGPPGGGMPPEMPMDMGPQGGPPMPPPGEMPMEAPPMGSEMAPQDMGALPQTATVMAVEGEEVVLQDDSGKMRRVPIGAFPIPPQEGMQMVQAVVGDINNGVMTALVGPEQVPIELPIDNLTMPFNPGDMFWMPEPPQAPDSFA